MKVRTLFLCTGNSCRSQMAEGWARHLKYDRIEAASVGVEIHGLNTLAVKVMAEVGVDISNQHSKTTDELAGREFDFVITLCNHADENGPFFPATTRVIYHGFDDPPKLARKAETEEEALLHYRWVRDEILTFVKKLPESIVTD